MATQVFYYVGVLFYKKYSPDNKFLNIYVLNNILGVI